MALPKQNPNARAQQTYSGLLLLLMLCLAVRAAFAQSSPQLTEAVLEVTLSDKEPGEMIVVLRGPQGQLYLDESDFARLRLAFAAERTLPL